MGTYVGNLDNSYLIFIPERNEIVKLADVTLTESKKFLDEFKQFKVDPLSPPIRKYIPRPKITAADPVDAERNIELDSFIQFEDLSNDEIRTNTAYIELNKKPSNKKVRYAVESEKYFSLISNLNDNPSMVEESLSRPDAEFWRMAMEEEEKAHIRNTT